MRPLQFSMFNTRLRVVMMPASPDGATTAEGEGFEPPEAHHLGRFQDGHHKPLGHPSMPNTTGQRWPCCATRHGAAQSSDEEYTADAPSRSISRVGAP